MNTFRPCMALLLIPWLLVACAEPESRAVPGADQAAESAARKCAAE